MPRIKTILTPEQQWDSTIRYVQFLARQEVKQSIAKIYETAHRENRALSGDELVNILALEDEYEAAPVLPSSTLWVASTPHFLLNIGDIFFVTCINGMVERFGMTGVSSKGARLHHCFIPLRRRYNSEIELPGDLIDLRCDDPAIGRFVADLRASSRRRVGASIPAPPKPPVEDSIEVAPVLRVDGCYRSRRGPRHKRTEHFNRNYLRFFPDGTVVAGPYGGFSQRNREWFVGGAAHGMGQRGRFSLIGKSLRIVIFYHGQEVEEYIGKVEGARLYLARRCRQGWGESREDDVYYFGPWE